MKKILVALLVALMFVCPAFAQALNSADAPWYELSSSDTVLTVRLPGNTKTGLVWSYEISNPAALELLTQETIVGESEGMAGAATTYVASFKTNANTMNDTSLILRCMDENSPEEPAVYTCVLDLSTYADNTIEINSALENESFADWCEYGDDGYTLTVRLPDAGWSFQIVDEELVELITCDDSDGAFVASFMATMNAAGDAEVVFTSDDGLRYRTVNMFVNESGAIFVNWTEDFEIFEQAQLIYCELCSGWYEAGNIYRNHVCVPQHETPKATGYYSAQITGGSVNLRQGPGTEYDVITVLKKGATGKYLGESDYDTQGTQWYNVTYGKHTGWVSSKYVEIGARGYVQIVNGNVNVRSKPHTEAEILTSVKQYSVVTYLGKGAVDEREVDWYYVSANGKAGWISSKYAKFVSSPGTKEDTKGTYVIISGGDCSMRKGADLNASLVTTLKNGTVCNYLHEKATDTRGVDWYHVSHNDKSGWVSSKYAKITNTLPEAETDMRLVYNPNRYNVLRITDIYSQNGRDYFVTGTFGTLSNDGTPKHFNEGKSVTMPLVPGAEVLLPADISDDLHNIDYVTNPEIWFNNARTLIGSDFYFYAGFSMNEGGGLRNISYLYVD
ncbi:MAG: SH3 domain-containing protein [Eubacteriales bacterium]|nr:SH3 domain-containing protein [Eubacteriales bacterium]